MYTLLILRVSIKTNADWTDEQSDAVTEAVESELDNVKDLIEQKLSKIPEHEDLFVEVSY